MGDAAMPKLKLEWSETVTWEAEIEITDDEIERFRSEKAPHELIAAVKDSARSQALATPQAICNEFELLSFEIEKADGTKVYMSDR